MKKNRKHHLRPLSISKKQSANKIYFHTSIQENNTEVYMKHARNAREMIVLFFVIFTMFLLIVTNAQALEPKLLWEKKLPHKIDGIKMATQSGDVILYSQKARQIILYDKNGNKLFHWGPRIDRQPMGVSISDDGNVILFATSRTEAFALKSKDGGWDNRIHYVTRKGKELWSKQIEGAAKLSPDGKLVAVYPSAGDGADLTMLDSQGKVIWKYSVSEVNHLVFSSDGNYLIISYGAADTLETVGGELHLLDKLGNLLWKKHDCGYGVTNGAVYVNSCAKKVYDKQGNIFINGDVGLSDDGKKLILTYPNKVSILVLPDKTVIKEYPFDNAWFLSSDGRFLYTVKETGNLLVTDTTNQDFKEIPIKGNYVSDSSKDGKYFLVIAEGNRIYFYQTY